MNKESGGQVNNRIIGGDDAQPGRYPYLASLARRGVGHRCGGTLIAPDVILTAGHCAFQFEEAQLGRHDLTDREEAYEVYLARDTVRHPAFFASSPTDVDEFDFALVKLFGHADGTPLVKINRNASLPAHAGDQLVVMGWGTETGTGGATDILQETTLDYIPNDHCKTFETEEVDFEKRVIGVSLCAIDFVNGEDACTGDSGGPILEIVDGTDVQVGVTSYGVLACANGIFPAFYARVSYVRNWIDETVCQLSNRPPADFSCPDVGSREPDLSSGDLIALTMDIVLDNGPESIGWVLESKNEQGANVTYASKQILSYAGLADQSAVKEVVQVPNNRQYTFIILDRNGNWFGTVTISQGDQVYVPPTKGTFSFYQSFDFVVGTPPTPAPTITPSPTTPAPTMAPPFVTIVIEFDKYPEETGWLLEALLEENDPMLVKVVWPNTYNVPYSRVEEKVDLLLPGQQPEATRYRFTMTDNERDGMCCKFGNGTYQVWLGLPRTEEGGVLLIEGGEFFLEDINTFELQPKQSLADSSSSRVTALVAAGTCLCYFLITALL